MDLPELEIPREWRRISEVLTVLDVAYPLPTTPVSELRIWIDWWWPAYEAAYGIAPELVEKMRTSGWWPPYQHRQRRIPDVVSEGNTCQLYWPSRRRIDDRSRAMHRAIGEQLKADPALIGVAKNRAMEGVADHRQSGVCESPFSHWIKILGYPIEHALEAMSFDSERMDYLRQYSPFAGMLPSQIRLEIFWAFATPSKAG